MFSCFRVFVRQKKTSEAYFVFHPLGFIVVLSSLGLCYQGILMQGAYDYDLQYVAHALNHAVFVIPT